MIGAFCKRVAVALDILLNVLLGGAVEPISSRCGKQIVDGKPSRPCCILCRFIDRLLHGRWKDHCKNNIWRPYQ